MNCLFSFRTENKLKSHELVRKNKDFCGILMPSEKNSILEFDKYMKSDKMLHIIYADIESLIKKSDRCTINPEKSSIIKIRNIFLCEYSISAIWEFDHTENKQTLYHEKYCMKNFCESLREHTKNITGFERKECCH